VRWVKHLTTAHKDPEVDALLERFGATAYGVYWLIVEEIASAMEPGRDAPEAIRSVQKWAHICRVQPRVFRKIIARLAVHLMIVSETDDKRLKIIVPNILKYRDEYSRKSGHAPDPTKTQTGADAKEELAGAQTEEQNATRIPAQTSQSASPFESIAVSDPVSRSLAGRSGLRKATSVPSDVIRALDRSELADDVDRMRRHLNAINTDRLAGRLSAADAGTAKNVLAAIRVTHPRIDADAAADLLIRGLNDQRGFRPESWGLIVHVAREL
jgi:hypothetical protein